MSPLTRARHDGQCRTSTGVRDTVGKHDVQIILEPGRFLVGEAGVLLTKVIFVKKGENLNPDTRKQYLT